MAPKTIFLLLNMITDALIFGARAFNALLFINMQQV